MVQKGYPEYIKIERRGKVYQLNVGNTAKKAVTKVTKQDLKTNKSIQRRKYVEVYKQTSLTNNKN